MTSPSRPRATGLYLLLLVPLVLVGVAFVWVRSRAPHPTTAGDAWLWEQADTVPSVTILFGDAGESIVRGVGLPYHSSAWHLGKNVFLDITDREGIEDLLHALEGTPAFRPGKAPFHSVADLNAASVAQLMLEGGEIMAVTREPRGSFLYLERSHQVAPLSQQSAARFNAALSKVLDKGRDQEDGYKLHLFSAAQEKRIEAAPPSAS